MPRTAAASHVAKEPPAAQPISKRGPGRPSRGDTVQVTLRIPRCQLTQLTAEGARRTAATGRTVTAQAVIMELVEAQFPSKLAR